MLDRSDLLLRYFGYLVNDFGFELERKQFDPGAMGNAVLVFKSRTVSIEIVVDRNDVLISIGDPLDRRWDWFEFTDVMKYYAPEIPTAYVFPQKTSDNTWDEMVEIQVDRLSKMLRQYCEPLLKGEPLMKRELKQIENERVTKRYGKFMDGS